MTILDTEPTTIGLPSGGSVTLRSAATLRGRDKTAVRRAAAAADAANRQELGVVIEEELARRLVTAWTLPYLPGAKLPSEDPATWEELEIADFDAIVTAARPAVEVLFPAPATPDDAGVPGSPTEPTEG